VSLAVNGQNINDLVGRAMLAKHLIEAGGPYLDRPNRLRAVGSVRRRPPPPSKPVESGFTVQHQLLLATPIRDCKLQIDVTWPHFAKSPDDVRNRVDVDASPPALAQQGSVRKPNWVMRSDIHEEARVGRIGVLRKQKYILTVLRK